MAKKQYTIQDPPSPPSSKPDTNNNSSPLGILMFMIACTTFTLTTIGYKQATAKFGISQFETIYYAQLVNMVCQYICVRVTQTDFMDVPKDCVSTLMQRSVIGYLADIPLFVAQMFTSYSKSFVVLFTNTLMIPFFAHYMIGEKIFCVDVTSTVVGFIGLLFTVVPYPDFESLFAALGSGSLSSDSLGQNYSYIRDLIGVALAFFAAVSSAI